MPTLRRSSRSVGRRDVGAAGERDAVDDDPPGLKSFEAGDRAEDRRLAGAGRPHDRDQLAARDLAG